MSEKPEIQEIFSKKIRAGRRTYFFDVRSTKAGDYYMTITESIKDINEKGESSYRKHKIYLYKEEFNNFKEAFNQVSNFIISEKGEEIISNKKSENNFKEENSENETQSNANFTEVNFEDLGKD
tara:strand:+ start:4710 stop:5081 length:372 start_codon:yes stop_codon:yes gene_type:complete